MSNSAITWAFSADVRRSADKLILVCLANHANEDGLCWPSQAKLIEQTSLDRKTVIASLKRLAESGWLQDTGRRRGQSGQVPIIQLVLTRVSEPRRFVRDEDMQSEIPGKSSVFPAPPTPSDSPEIPARESQFSREGVPFFPPGGPKNGIRKPHRTLIEPTMNPHCTPPLGDLLMALNGDETAPGEDSPRPSDPKPEKPPKRAKA